MTGAPRDPEALLAHAHWVRTLALQLCADVHAAEDAAQDTLAAALRHPPQDPRRARGFLARTLRNALAMTRRKERRRAAREAQVALPRDAVELPASELVARAELHRQLVGAVLNLPASWRELVLRHYFEGVDVAALALRMHCSADAVRAQLRRARERLRGELEGGGGAPARALALLVATSRPLATASASTTAVGFAAAAMGVMTIMKTAVLLGVAALAAAMWLLWPGATPTVPAVAGQTADAPVRVAADASPGAAANPAANAPAVRTELPAPDQPLALPFRLEGLRAEVPWTASFTVRAEGSSFGLRQEHDDHVAIAAEGTFTVPLPAWTRAAGDLELRLEARDPFYLPVEVRLGPEVRLQNQPIVLQVEPACVVTGKVVDAHDLGVPAARVCAFLPFADRNIGDSHTRASTTTDADGNYRLQVPIAANLTLLAVPMHEASLSGLRVVMQGGGIQDDNRMRDDLLPASLRVDTSWGQITEAPILHLPEPAFVSGRLTTHDGEPLPGVEMIWLHTTSDASLYDRTLSNLMTWADGSAGRIALAKTDANGRFRLPATPGKDGVCYPRDGRRRNEPFVTPVRLTPPAEVDFRLAGDVALLRVLCGGMPLPGVGVATDTMGDRLTPSDSRRRTDEHGEVRFLRSERIDQMLTIRRPGAAPTEVVLPATASLTQPVLVDLPPLPTVAVQLEFEAAHRVRQIELTWARLDEQVEPLRMSCARNDGDGPFHVDVPPGRYRLTVSAPSRAERRDTFLVRTTQEVEVSLRGAELRLAITHGGRTHVAMTGGNGDWIGGMAQLVGKAGTFQFMVDYRNPGDSENLPAGSYELRISSGKRVAHQGTVEVRSCEVTDVRVRLP